MQDIRWKQRFSNYLKALGKLQQSVNFIKQQPPVPESEHVLIEMLREGLIQRFEYTHELAWNVMKDYAEYQGNTNVGGSRDATREAFRLKLIEDGHAWMDMIGSRNLTSHTYNEAVANEIYQKIITVYFPAFEAFGEVMRKKQHTDQTEI